MVRKNPDSAEKREGVKKQKWLNVNIGELDQRLYGSFFVLCMLDFKFEIVERIRKRNS